MALVNGRETEDEHVWRQVDWALGPFTKVVAELQAHYPGINAEDLIDKVTEAVQTAIFTEVKASKARGKHALQGMFGALAVALIDRERLRERVAEFERCTGRSNACPNQNTAR